MDAASAARKVDPDDMMVASERRHYRAPEGARCPRTVDEQQRRRLARAVVDHVHPSGGNYLLTCLVGSSAEVAHTIRQKLLAGFRIEVKDVSGRFPDGRPRLRLAVRTPDDNARLLDALRAAGAAA